MTQTTKRVMFLVLTVAMLLIVNPVAAQTPQQAAVKMGPDLPDELKAFAGPTGAWGKDRWDCARKSPRIGFMPELIFLEIQRDEALARYVIPESFTQWGIKASDRQVKGKFEKGADGKLRVVFPELMGMNFWVDGENLKGELPSGSGYSCTISLQPVR